MKEAIDKGQRVDETQMNAPALSAWTLHPSIFVAEVGADNKTYRFFAKDREGEPAVRMEGLSLEFFNHELQRVDTTSEASLLRFCERWGMPFSPLYASKSHAMAGRDADTTLSYPRHFPISYRDDAQAVQGRLIADIVAFKGSCGFNSVEKAAALLIGSEFAREAIARGDYGDPARFGAVVAADEVAYTIRLLQLATAMQVASAAGLSGFDLRAYLLNDRVIPRRHPYELEERDGLDLFFSNTYGASALVRQQEVADDALGGSGARDVRKARLARMEAIADISMALGVENARSFTAQATLNLALENAGIREGGDASEGAILPEGESLWDMPTQMTEGSLVEAILANFDFVMKAPFEWRTCEHCGRIFKYQKEYDPKNRYRKSTFCRNSCRVMNAQALRREEMEHGAARAGKDGLTPGGESQKD